MPKSNANLALKGLDEMFSNEESRLGLIHELRLMQPITATISEL